MLKYFNPKTGQVTSEYAITILIGFTVIMAMGVFVKRTIQGRVYDARSTMAKTVEARWGKKVPWSYEPYILNSDSDVNLSMDQTKLLIGGGPGPEIFKKDSTSEVTTDNTTIHLPPKDAQ